MAARLNFGSANRAMIAARKGPSKAIITHVAASGSQNIEIFLFVIRFDMMDFYVYVIWSLINI